MLFWRRKPEASSSPEVVRFSLPLETRIEAEPLGDTRFDALHVIRMPDRSRGRRLIARELPRLQALGALTVELRGAELHATMRPGASKELMYALSALRDLLGPMRVAARVVPGTGRCGYCHDALEANAPRRVCERCGTELHAACWAEHGGCPVLGCN